MITAIIHDTRNLSRAKYVGGIHDRFPDINLIHAQSPEWESSPFRRAVRGCTLSHLLAVRALLTPADPLLVLEDDAVEHAGKWAEWKSVEGKIPKDAGIVLLGGKTPHLDTPDGYGFARVKPPWFHSHAVIYMPALTQTPWLLDAYATLAASAMGEDDRGGGLCAESILCLALEGAGLSLYRAPVTVFGTAEAISARTGEVEGAMD